MTSLTDSAAPPRASPSSLERITPSSASVCVEGLGRRRRRPGRSWRRRRGTCSSGSTASEIWRTCSIISASMARRPAVSTMSDVAAEAAGLVEAAPGDVSTGSPGSLNTGTSIWRPSVRSCSTAAGRWRSAPTSSGLRPWLLEPAGQLGGVGRLARALEAGHQHDRRRPAGVGDLQRLAAEDVGQLLVDDLDDLLAGLERLATARRRSPARGCGRRRCGRRSTLTSASSRAVRISRRTSSTSASVRRPLPRRRLKIPSKRSDRASNMRSARLPDHPAGSLTGRGRTDRPSSALSVPVRLLHLNGAIR